MHRLPLQRLAFAALFCTGIFLLGACSSGSDEAEGSNADLVIVEAEPTPEAFDASDSDQLAGVSTDPSAIEAGDCFNEYLYKDLNDSLVQVTTLVSCDGLHDREAYFEVEYPAGDEDPIPADDVLRRWAEAACLEEFEDFVGLEYVLSKLEIGAIVPSFKSWTDDGDRSITCFVYPDQAGRRLKSSVRGSRL